MSARSLTWIGMVLLCVSVWHASTGAQRPSSVLQGVYTAEQAKRGAVVYKDACAACHGEDLKGMDPLPPLTGPAFVSKWKTVADLFEKIDTTMPALDPGSLSKEKTADLIAYIFSVGKYPAGTMALASSLDSLKAIRIEATK